MEHKQWSVELEGSRHAVTLDWTYFGGYREVRVDDRVVDESRIPMRWRSTQSFAIDGHPAVVRTEPSRRLSPYFVIGLEVDGRLVESDTPLSKWEKRG